MGEFFFSGAGAQQIHSSAMKLAFTFFSYRCSSHRGELGADVILYEDSELSYDDLYHSVGYSPSSGGSQVVDWQPLNVSNSMTRRTNERLDKEYVASLHYKNLPLRHGTMYYVNVDVTNVLGYRSTLSSKGTMVDFTPPEPGAVGDAGLDVVVADGCTASIIQRCENADQRTLNHR